MLLSFNCPACKTAFSQIEPMSLLLEDVKIAIRFSLKKDRTTIEHLLGLMASGDKKELLAAIQARFEDSNFESWSKKFPIRNNVNAEKTELIEMYDRWYKKISIKFTPAFLFNGLLVPKTYNIEDLKILLSNRR